MKIRSALERAVEKAHHWLQDRRRLKMMRIEQGVSDKLDRGQIFADNELVYSAYRRCRCGAGFAYPQGIGGRGAWYCSELLKDPHATSEDHDPALPFVFWEIKSELQASANGATTRPKE